MPTDVPSTAFSAIALTSLFISTGFETLYKLSGIISTGGSSGSGSGSGIEVGGISKAFILKVYSSDV